MRRDRLSDVRLSGSGRGDQDQFCTAHRDFDVRRGSCDRDIPDAVNIAYSDHTALENGRKRGRISTPQPDLVAFLAQVGRRRVGAVAASQNRNPHADFPST